MKKLKKLKPSIKLDSHPIVINKNDVRTDDNFCLKGSDFYPPSDDRVWKSNIEDIDGGDNFADYCEEFFQMLDEEDYWES